MSCDGTIRKLNTYVNPFMGAMNICTDKLQEWRQQNNVVSILDLRKVYLQISVKKIPVALSDIGIVYQVWVWPECSVLDYAVHA